MRFLFIFSFHCLVGFACFAQTFTSSNLPVVSIDTYGQTIPASGKIIAYMRIIFKSQGMLNSLSDSANVWSGLVEIDQHGASSATYPQKSYGFTTMMNTSNDSNVPLLNMPREHDWLLITNYNDKSF